MRACIESTWNNAQHFKVYLGIGMTIIMMFYLSENLLITWLCFI